MPQFPYHVDSLLTVAEYCKHGGDVSMAADFVGTLGRWGEGVPWHPHASPDQATLYTWRSRACAPERALYSFERAFHPLFTVTTGLCRLRYAQRENRYDRARRRRPGTHGQMNERGLQWSLGRGRKCSGLFIALFHHIHYLGRRSCWRAALEACKLLAGCVDGCRRCLAHTERH